MSQELGTCYFCVRPAICRQNKKPVCGAHYVGGPDDDLIPEPQSIRYGSQVRPLADDTNSQPMIAMLYKREDDEEDAWLCAYLEKDEVKARWFWASRLVLVGNQT